MNQLIANIRFLWTMRLAPHWPTIVPLMFVLIGIVWFALVYARGRFRFLPALAIARVTVLDSIGRLEVIILLGIGMLWIGVSGILPNTMEGEKALEGWTSMPYIQERLQDMSGLRSFTPPEDVYFEPVEQSTYEGEEAVQPSAGAEETGLVGGFTGDGDGDAEGTETEGGLEDEGEIGPAAELAGEQHQATLKALIWQGTFMMADIFVALIGFILAMMVLPNEINRGVTLSILPKPLSREEYVFGKAMGIWLIVTGCFLILSLELFAIHAVFETMQGRNPWDWHFLQALILFPFKYASLVLIIMGLTLRMPEVPAGIIGIAVFATSHFLDKIYEMSDAPLLNVVWKVGLKVTYWMLPHLSQVTFSILDPYGSLLNTMPEIWGWVWQISVYNMILLWLLSFLFRRRSL
jgi:hypothetical protein